MHTWPVEIRWGIVRQDHAEIEIAVRTAITPGGRAEQIDTLRANGTLLHGTAPEQIKGKIEGSQPLISPAV
jgi:hypothetical protein